MKNQKMRFFLIVITLLIAFAIQRCYCTKGKVTYKWKANLTAGSLLPNEHLSSYSFDAQLTIFVNGKIFEFQIGNIISKNVLLNESELYSPFRVVYENSNVQLFADGSDEKVLNMKRSLADLFNLNDNFKEKKAFETQENGTYGYCNVEYIVSKTNSSTKITKLIDEASCSRSTRSHHSNTPGFTCPSFYQEGVSNHNKRMYVILNNQYPFIQEIQSIGSIHFQPFQALAEAHYVHVSQLLTIKSIEQRTEAFANDLTNTKKLVDIMYTSAVVHDPTSGRLPPNKTMLKIEIYQLLEMLTNNLDWKLSTNNLDNQTSFQILELMWFLGVHDWEELYQNISVGTSYTEETMQHFFWEFVPQVGSEASIVFIKNLITSKKVTGFSASFLLITFPLHVKEINEKFLLESKGFLRLTDNDAEVRNSGILSYASLIRRVCTDGGHCSKEFLDRQTKYFLDQFMESTDHQDQMVYLQGLCNMQLSRTVDFLGPIITNPSYGRHIRYLAIRCSLQTIHKQNAKAVDIFWPIFTNTSEPLEIRVSALNLLIQTQPTANRLLTFFWHMRDEPNYHVYNFFYTTVHSFANTKYPCYQKIRHIASQLSRYLLPKAYRWATGNYILDYEDTVRGYGGAINFFIVASETTGLPSNFYVDTEQHSHGLSSRFSLHLKLEGIVDPILRKLNQLGKTTSFFRYINITEFLRKHNITTNSPEKAHVEAMVAIDGNTVYCKYVNDSSFDAILEIIKNATDVYYEFSVNYQRLRFPIRYDSTLITNIGTPVALQIRTSSVLSLRGRIKQSDGGVTRNADLDFSLAAIVDCSDKPYSCPAGRYSMNTVTSLKTMNFIDQTWYGADRLRSLHFRIPFSTNVIEKIKNSFYRVTIDRRNQNFSTANGSPSGFVWHSTIKLFPQNNGNEVPLAFNNSTDKNHWSVESCDLGASFEAKVFDCKGDNVLDSLNIIKEAFQLANKNYKMITGGVPILGLYSLANYFTFIPPGDSCGIIMSTTPLQVQLNLVREGWTFRVTLEHEKGRTQIWDLITVYKDDENEGIKRIDFHLQHPAHSQSIDNATISFKTGSWKLKQFDGHLLVPSIRQGILKAPRPVEAQVKIAWGTRTQATSVEIELHSDNKEENWPSDCENDTVDCLQSVSNLATTRTVYMKCVNLPIWVTTALLSIFPENIRADKSHTNVSFSLPARLPWTTEGECIINSNKILDFDNGTIRKYKQRTDCYSTAIGDCAENSQFVVGVRKINNEDDFLEMKILASYNLLTILPSKNVEGKIKINDFEIPVTNVYQYYPKESNVTNFIFQYKYWEKSKMIEVAIADTGLILQYYGRSIVMLAEFKLRGKMCGMCGDFNGEMSNDAGQIICIDDIYL